MRTFITLRRDIATIGPRSRTTSQSRCFETSYGGMSVTIAARRSNQRVAWLLWILLAGLFLFGETLALLNRLDGPHTWEDFGWAFIPITFAMGLLGCLILSRLPSHAVGWLLTVVGLMFEVSFTTTEYAYHTLIANPGSLPLGLEITP